MKCSFCGKKVKISSILKKTKIYFKKIPIICIQCENKCEIKNCENKIYCHDFCKEHYLIIKKEKK